jgi:tRNA-modifying protein YgfZ
MDVAARERAFVRIAGPDARTHLQNLVSNDVDGLAVGDACPALLLTARARVVAPVVVWRRANEDYLVLTEPELGAAVRALLVRMRMRLRCEIESEEHTSLLVFGGGEREGFETDFPGAVELLDADLAPTLDPAELELRRIEAGVPRWGREIDDRILPAEAGLDSTHISFSKGCYPGQEPVARLHYRGHANRGLRVLQLADLPAYDAELMHDGKVVGRVTSAARRPDGSVVALAFVRSDVPDDAALDIADAAA